MEIFTIENLFWILKQPVMMTLYTFLVVSFVLERIEIINERKSKIMKINKAMSYIGRIKINWVKANSNQSNILCGLDFMKRTFDKGIVDAIQVARTNPESVESYMEKVHDELLSMCATPSAKILLDEVFDA